MQGTLKLKDEFMVVLSRDELTEISRAIYMLELLAERIEEGTFTIYDGLGLRCQEHVSAALKALGQSRYVSTTVSRGN